MPRTATPLNERIIEKLREAGDPQTAAALGVPTARMKEVPGVIVAGNVQTGRQGRPALLFALSD